MRAAWMLLMFLAAGCGPAQHESTPTPPSDAAGADSASSESAPSADRGTDAEAAAAGLPQQAVRLPNDQERKLWAMTRPDGRVMVYELLPDGMLSAVGGDLAELPAIYPGVDFSVLETE